MATAYHMEALRKQRVLNRMAAAQVRINQEHHCHQHHHHRHHCNHHHNSQDQVKLSRSTSAQSQASVKSRASQPNSAAFASRQPSTKPSSPTPAETAQSSASSQRTPPTSAENNGTSRTQTASSQTTHSKCNLGSRQSSHSVSTPKPPGTSSSMGSAKNVTAPSGPVSTRSSKVTTPELAGREAALSVAGTSGTSGEKRSAAGTPTVQGIPKGPKTPTCSCTCSHNTCSKCGLCSRCGEESRATSRMTRSHNSTYTPLEPATAKEKEEAIWRDLHKQEYVLRDSNLVMGNINVDEEMELRNQQ